MNTCFEKIDLIIFLHLSIDECQVIPLFRFPKEWPLYRLIMYEAEGKFFVTHYDIDHSSTLSALKVVERSFTTMN